MEIRYIKWKILAEELNDWEFITLPDDTRLYFKDNDGNGFHFKQVNMVICTMGEQWIDMEADCEIELNGVAYFDGIRHLYFGDDRGDNYGYFYYPSLENMVEALQELRKLELKYCKQLD